MRCCRMLLSAVRDTTGELARCKGPEPATCPGPAQTQPQGARQAELVICDKAIERSLGWYGRWRRLSKDYETLPEVSEAMVTLAAIRLMLHRLVHPNRRRLPAP